MVKKAKFICVFAVSGLFCTDFAMADSFVVKDGVIFSTGADSLNISLVSGENHPSSCTARSIDVPNATADSDIDISGTNAFVKTDGAVATISIPECLVDDALSIGDCIAKANLSTGELTVPCVDVEDDGIDTIYDAFFEHLGNSPNWRLNSAIPNVRFQNNPGENR